MNENLENETNETQAKPSMRTKQEAQKVEEQLIEKRTQIIEDAPKLSLSIKKAPYYLGVLFEQDGTPKGDFTVTDRFKRKVTFAFKHPHRKSTTGEMYFGELSDGNLFNSGPNEYLIQATPTFLTDEELDYLKSHHRLTKMIGNTEIEFVPPILQRDDYSYRVERYKERIGESREKIQELNGIIQEIERIKPRLSMGAYEVIIEQPEEREEKVEGPGYPNR
jgi:hypothetical protein